MNNKRTVLLGIVLLVLAVCAIVVWYGRGGQQDGGAEVPTPVVSTTPTTAVRIFENEYIRISLLDGWEVQSAASVQRPGAVNIRKGKYILYINPRAQQASGVEGGRFSEVAMGAPSVTAVITEHPVPPCGDPVPGGAYGPWQRQDLYVEATTTAAWCRKPSGDKSVWYFSYVTTDDHGYFNYYQAGEPQALVITVAYDSTAISELPERGSSELKSILDEVGRMVETMSVIKP